MLMSLQLPVLAVPLWFLRESPFPPFLSLLWPLPDPKWLLVCRCGLVGCSSPGFFFSFHSTASEKLRVIFGHHFSPWLVSWLTTHWHTVPVSTPASPPDAYSFSILFDGKGSDIQTIAEGLKRMMNIKHLVKHSPFCLLSFSKATDRIDLLNPLVFITPLALTIYYLVLFIIFLCVSVLSSPQNL